MKLLYAAAASTLASLGHGSPFPSFAERQAPGSYYPITGATGGVHPRLEIRELQKNAEMYNLFLLALADFQALNQNNIDSYYQIAGIHGQPWYVDLYFMRKLNCWLMSIIGRTGTV